MTFGYKWWQLILFHTMERYFIYWYTIMFLWYNSPFACTLSIHCQKMEKALLEKSAWRLTYISLNNPILSFQMNLWQLSVYETSYTQKFNFHRKPAIFSSSFNMSASMIWFATPVWLPHQVKHVKSLYIKRLDCYPNEHFLSGTNITLFCIKNEW